MKEKKGYWSWWWNNNCWWIVIPGIIIAALGGAYLLAQVGFFLADILPKWIQACILLGGLIICISLLCAGSYWKHQDYLKEKNSEVLE